MFLSALAADLTVGARDTYVAGTDGVARPEALRTFNELMHRIMNHQRNLLSHARHRYPEDVFFDIIKAFSEELKVSRRLINMLASDTLSAKPRRLKQIA